MSLKIINANIKRVATNAAKLNTLVQTTAILCIQHAQDHGDANPAMRLIAALPKTVRRNALSKWFGTYSPINATVEKCSLRKPDSKAFNAFNLEGARANNWYEMPELDKEEIFLTAEDFDDNVVSLTKRMQKKLDDNKVLAADIPAFTQKLAALKAFAA
jgi:hypothetical protein